MSKSVARARPVLIVAQVALTIVLVTGASLLLRSFITIRGVDTGFESSAFNARLWLDDSYQTERAQRRFFSQLLDGVRARQGVEVAGLVDALPLSHSERMSRFEVQGFANQREQLIHTRAASPVTSKRSARYSWMAGRSLRPTTTNGRACSLSIRHSRSSTSEDDRRSVAACGFSVTRSRPGTA
jgi:hypothetical protein